MPPFPVALPLVIESMLRRYDANAGSLTAPGEVDHLDLGDTRGGYHELAWQVPEHHLDEAGVLYLSASLSI
jgi:hypothetical protein